MLSYMSCPCENVTSISSKNKLPFHSPKQQIPLPSTSKRERSSMVKKNQLLHIISKSLLRTIHEKKGTTKGQNEKARNQRGLLLLRQGTASSGLTTNNIQGSLKVSGKLKVLASYGGGLGPGSQKHSHSCQNSHNVPNFCPTFPRDASCLSIPNH